MSSDAAASIPELVATSETGKEPKRVSIPAVEKECSRALLNLDSVGAVSGVDVRVVVQYWLEPFPAESLPWKSAQAARQVP